MKVCFWCGGAVNSEGYCADCAHPEERYEESTTDERNAMATVGATVWVDGSGACTLGDIKDFVEAALALGFSLDHRLDDPMYVVRESSEVFSVQCGDHAGNEVKTDVVVRLHDCT